jgi:hypothetical protein
MSAQDASLEAGSSAGPGEPRDSTPGEPAKWLDMVDMALFGVPARAKDAPASRAPKGWVENDPEDYYENNNAERFPHNLMRDLPAVGDPSPPGPPGTVVAWASRRGRGHALDGGYREDSALGYIDEHAVYLAAADGLGSSRMSREGSRLAVNNAIEAAAEHLGLAIRQFSGAGATWEPAAVIESLRKVLYEAGTAAKGALLDRAVPIEPSADTAAIEQGEEGSADSNDAYASGAEGLAAQPRSDSRAAPQAPPRPAPVELKDLSTTLILTVQLHAAPQYLGVLHAGDGAVALEFRSTQGRLERRDGGNKRPPGQYLNEVQSLSQANIEASIVVHVTPEMTPIVRTLLLTDGVADDFPVGGPFDPDMTFDHLDTALAAAEPGTPISGSLHEWMGYHVKGSFDDRTAVMCDIRGRSEPWTSA